MSLIERALGKMQKSAGDRHAQPSRYRPEIKVPPVRSVAEPQLRVTRPMLDRLGLTVPAGQEHQHAAEYRHIKRQIVDEIQTKPEGRVVMVASALAGEGKSFTAANLARSLAMEPDYTVLLVDADAVKPHVSASLQLVDLPGLMNALVDTSIDIESLVVTTDIEGLSILPAGSASEQATEYFASDRMHAIVERLLAVPNRIVVIDSLPILLTTEARALLPYAAQVVVVVRAESTPQKAVEQALKLIGEEANVKLLLNAVPPTRFSRYLGYDYGYQYSYSQRE